MNAQCFTCNTARSCRVASHVARTLTGLANVKVGKVGGKHHVAPNRPASHARLDAQHCNTKCNTIFVATVALHGKAGEMQQQHVGYTQVYTPWVLHTIPLSNVEKNWSTAPCDYLPDSRWCEGVPKRESHGAGTFCCEFTELSDVRIFDSSSGSARSRAILLFANVVFFAHNSAEALSSKAVINTLFRSWMVTARGLKLPRHFASRVLALLTPAHEKRVRAIQSGVWLGAEKVKQMTVNCDRSHRSPFIKCNTHILPRLRVATASQNNNTFHGARKK
jgi:hypothetical protein